MSMYTRRLQVPTELAVAVRKVERNSARMALTGNKEDSGQADTNALTHAAHAQRGPEC